MRDKVRAEIVTTAEKMQYLVPLIRNLEWYTRSELKNNLFLTWPNDWEDTEGRKTWETDIPHWYAFANSEGTYDVFWDGERVYFRIDTLEWDQYEGRYVPCTPKLTSNWITVDLNLKKTDDPLEENYEVYQKMLKKRGIHIKDNSYQKKWIYGRTYFDEATWKHYAVIGQRRPRVWTRAKKNKS